MSPPKPPSDEPPTGVYRRKGLAVLKMALDRTIELRVAVSQLKAMYGESSYLMHWSELSGRVEQALRVDADSDPLLFLTVYLEIAGALPEFGEGVEEELDELETQEWGQEQQLLADFISKHSGYGAVTYPWRIFHLRCRVIVFFV